MKMTQSEFLEYAKKFNDEEYSEEKADKIVKILTEKFGFRIDHKKQEKRMFLLEGRNKQSVHKQVVPRVEGFFIKVDYEAGKAIKVYVDRSVFQGSFYWEIEDYDTTDKFKTNQEAKEAIEKIKKLASSYDYYTQYIENYKQEKAAERYNTKILKEIDDLLLKL